MTNCSEVYGVRGRMPDQLSAGLTRRISAATSTQIQVGPVGSDRDVRLTKPALRSAPADRDLNYGNREAIDFGLRGTKDVYFQVSYLGAAGDVMLAVRDTPVDYNEMKLVRDGLYPGNGDIGSSDPRHCAN